VEFLILKRRLADANTRARHMWLDARELQDPKDAVLLGLMAHYEVLVTAVQLLGNDVLRLDSKLREARSSNGKPRRALRIVRDSEGMLSSIRRSIRQIRSRRAVGARHVLALRGPAFRNQRWPLRCLPASPT
jgi:hypothetical protein